MRGIDYFHFPSSCWEQRRRESAVLPSNNSTSFTRLNELIQTNITPNDPLTTISSTTTTTAPVAVPTTTTTTTTTAAGSSLEIDQRLSANIDYLFRLKDTSLQEAYHSFNLENQTLSSLLACGLFSLTISIPLYIVFGANLSRLSHDSFDIFNCVIVLGIMAFVNVEILRVYLQQRHIIQRHHGLLPITSKKFLQYFQKRIFLLLEIIMCYRHLVRTIGGQCVSNDGAIDTWNCNALSESKMIPAESAILIMLFPILYSITVRGAHFEFAFMLWVITMASLCASAVINHAENATLFIVYYTVLSLIIMIESRKQNYFLFFTHQKLEEILKDREKEADEANAQELRHMIANVAHDLKTPLASFLGGIEYISSCVVELATQTVSEEELRECLGSITACVTNMRNTNSFMLMTINRCIDYTKASKGVKLVPKYETIDLMETLSLPLNCMKDIQQRVSISFPQALSNDICSHIITDKQWLQENVLCLLSNAVKYSNEGTVTIHVSKVITTPPPPPPPPPPAAAEGLSWSNAESREETGSLITTALDYQTPPKQQLLPRGFSLSLIQLSPKLTTVEVEYLRIEVEDHGIGLSDDAMTTLFSPFKQAQRLAGGTGLGLFSLAKRIEALDGRCGVEKRRDNAQGSLFWFEIPYRVDREAARLFARGSGGVEGTVRQSSSVRQSYHHLPSIEERHHHAHHPHHHPNHHQHHHHHPLPSPVSDSGNSMMMASRKPSLSLSESSQSHSQSHHSSTIITTTGDFCFAVPSSLNILLVDDSPAILKMTSMMLLRHKHHVTTATNGAEAVKKVEEVFKSNTSTNTTTNTSSGNNGNVGNSGSYNEKKKGFDVILMDLQMPVMDGLEATKRLRLMEKDYYNSRSLQQLQQQPLPLPCSSEVVAEPLVGGDIESGCDSHGQGHGHRHRHDSLLLHQIIVGVSANSDTETANQAFLAGIDAFISKPFTMDAFYQTIDLAMKKEAHQRASYCTSSSLDDLLPPGLPLNTV